MRYSIQSFVNVTSSLVAQKPEPSKSAIQKVKPSQNRSSYDVLPTPTSLPPPTTTTTPPILSPSLSQSQSSLEPTTTPPPPPPNTNPNKDSPNSHPSRTLTDLARRMATKGPLKTLTTTKRIRFLFNGAMVADTLGTSGALYVWEHDMYPQFYLPMEAFVPLTAFDVHLTPGDSITETSNSDTIIGGGLRLSVKRRSAPDTDYQHLTEMVLFAADLSGPGAALSNMVKVTFDAVGQWFEEDSPIYVHPRDPFKRVDILTCSRPIRVLVNEVVVAQSQSSMHLYETLLPVRYYLPLTAVDTSLLRPSATRMLCPYKGESQFHSVAVRGEVYKDLVWYYTRPTVECAAIAGLCCFYTELVDVEFELGSPGSGRWRRERRPV